MGIVVVLGKLVRVFVRIAVGLGGLIVFELGPEDNMSFDRGAGTGNGPVIPDRVIEEAEARGAERVFAALSVHFAGHPGYDQTLADFTERGLTNTGAALDGEGDRG